MIDKVERKIDWVHLPTGVDEISLWGCLHDGELVRCETNIARQHVRLAFSIDHLSIGNANQTKFFLDISGVDSVRAHLLRRHGDYKEPENVSAEQRATLIKAYQENWREESMDWTEFESTLLTDPLQVVDASMVENEDSQSLRLAGFLDGEKIGDVSCEIFIRDKKISATRSDKKAFDMSEFIDLGDKYWETLGE